jgi:hypothetical protein
LIEHIDVIVGIGDSKKSMLDPTIMRSNNFKDDCRMLDVSRVNCLCQSTEHWYHY